MAEGLRGERGGIFGLLDLIEEHPSAVAYDWRTRFRLSPRVIGSDEMDWSEAVGHVKILRADPSSAIASALEGWDHPISRGDLAILDLYDLMLAINSDRKRGKPKPHPGRPFKLEDAKTRERRGTAVPIAQAAAILNRFGHSLPV